ncbi:hypothetical protein, partial [Daejeonella sp.]|uniref:hypothetical protein n=1 Tax=Daejeonella sp. TaxID=2805397 RepID=UPI0030C1C42C
AAIWVHQWCINKAEVLISPRQVAGNLNGSKTKTSQEMLPGLRISEALLNYRRNSELNHRMNTTA